MDKRTIIVGTVPYNNNGPSRAFESYFHGIESKYLAQVFSNPLEPQKGHCKTLYQVTDKMMLNRWMNRRAVVGRKYRIEQLQDMDSPICNSKDDSVIENRLYSFGAKHTPLSHLLRKILWRKKYWCTDEFVDWLDEFAPECVFISFSDEFFILDIALFISNRFDIPIVFTISDDYIFNDAKSPSPLYFLYRKLYKNKVRHLLSRSQYGVFICDKIRDKYNQYYNLQGETVYLTSSLKRKDFSPIPKSNPIIRYFGNVQLDRYKSLVEIGDALQRINKNYIIEVYTGSLSEEIKESFDHCKGIKFKGMIPYSEVCKKTEESDLLLVVEGFTELNIRMTRYSLSTKAADSLASGVNVFAYGSEECGLIDYLSKNDACMVCKSRKNLDDDLSEFLVNLELQKYYYSRSLEVYNKNHMIDVSSKITQQMICKAVDLWPKSYSSDGV